MIKVLLPLPKAIFNKKNIEYIELGVKIPESRPFLKFSPYYFHLNLEIHNWLVGQHISYTLGYNLGEDYDNFYFITFKKVDYAVLFKLTWGGK
jgi:hypothetical protein